MPLTRSSVVGSAAPACAPRCCIRKLNGCFPVNASLGRPLQVRSDQSTCSSRARFGSVTPSVYQFFSRKFLGWLFGVSVVRLLAVFFSSNGISSALCLIGFRILGQSISGTKGIRLEYRCVCRLYRHQYMAGVGVCPASL